MIKKSKEQHSEKLVGWLSNFADKFGEKVIKDNNINPQELKNAGYMDNILDIINRNKKISVEEKVAKYRELVGLDLVENLEKEGEQNTNKQASEKTASRIMLSIRDKTAQQAVADQNLNDRIKQYIEQVVRNRDGAIATPAIVEQLHNYLKVDAEWLRIHFDEIKQIVDSAKQQVSSNRQQPELPINDLARTDEPSKGEKEAPPFLPPAQSPA